MRRGGRGKERGRKKEPCFSSDYVEIKKKKKKGLENVKQKC